MHILASVLTLGVLGMVFGLAAITVGVIAVGVLYAPVREALDSLWGWRRLTCPQANTAVRVRVRRMPRGSRQRLVVVRCSRFGRAKPSCHQGCLSVFNAA